MSHKESPDDLESINTLNNMLANAIATGNQDELAAIQHLLHALQLRMAARKERRHTRSVRVTATAAAAAVSNAAMTTTASADNDTTDDVVGDEIDEPDDEPDSPKTVW